MKSYSSKKAKARGKPRQNLSRSTLDPPMFNMQPTNKRRMRFVNQAETDLVVQVSSSDMLGALGVVCIGGLNAQTFCAAFKVKSIELWATPKSDSDGAYQSAYVEWRNSTSFSKSSRVMDASNSNARPLHIHTSPPKDSVCDLWVHGTTVTELFALKVPSGAIIDIVCDYLLCDKNESHAVILPTSASTGEVWYLRLDRTTSASLTQIDRDT